MDKTKLLPCSYSNRVSFCFVAISSSPLSDKVKTELDLEAKKDENLPMTKAKRKLLARTESLKNHSWKHKKLK